jgi:VIT1/CCC1 family predicted Fe2+/Mn2+ transporter
MSESEAQDATVRTPRIPDTPERRNLERLRKVRELVFGAQDGLMTTLGIVTGVGGATADRATILLTGMISLFVGALSMGVGQYLGGKAEREVVEHWVDYEQREMIEKPDEEFAEQLSYYRLKGFTREEARTIVDRLAKNPQIWLHEMVRDEFGIDPRDAQGSGLGGVFAIAGSFVIGAIVPILPYFFAIDHTIAVVVSVALAAGALFGVGAVAGRLAHRNVMLKGLEIVLYGGAVFALSYLAGHYIPPLFGHHDVNLG